MILVFSTARRLHLFKKTLDSLIQFNPDLIDIIDEIYILDDRSSWDERDKMEKLLQEGFYTDRVTTITFNSNEEFAWVDKMNFLSKLSDKDNYILFIEDDWESIKPMNLQLHINFLDKNKNIDLITFNGNYKVQNTSNKDKWDYVTSYNDIYYSNPFPNGFRNIIAEDNGIFGWVGVKINNFSLNPSLYRSNIFQVKFPYNTNFEVEFANAGKLKQLFVRNGMFLHRGNEETLHDRIKYKNVQI
jgi:hypothetical protein|tara:strand:- start:1591 stop:2322 length:732 start_codon:yes stop_codon:yes gene_type:complete